MRRVSFIGRNALVIVQISTLSILFPLPLGEGWDEGA
jgi:hypothetical protein